MVIPAEGEGHIEIIAHADGIRAVGAGGGVVDNAGGGGICQALCHQHGRALEGDRLFVRILQIQLARHGAGNLMERPLHRCGRDSCAVTGECRKIHRAGDGLIRQLLVAIHIQLIVQRALLGQGFFAVARHGEGIRRIIRPMIHAVHIPVLPIRRGGRCDVHGDLHCAHELAGSVVKGGIALHRHFPTAHHDPGHQQVADIGGVVFQIVDGNALAGDILMIPIPALRIFGGDIQMGVPGLKDHRKIGDRQRRRQLIVRIGTSVFIRCKYLLSGFINGFTRDTRDTREMIGDALELCGLLREAHLAVKEVMPRLALGFEQRDGDRFSRIKRKVCRSCFTGRAVEFQGAVGRIAELHAVQIIGISGDQRRFGVGNDQIFRHGDCHRLGRNRSAVCIDQREHDLFICRHKVRFAGIGRSCADGGDPAQFNRFSYRAIFIDDLCLAFVIAGAGVFDEQRVLVADIDFVAIFGTGNAIFCSGQRAVAIRHTGRF